MGKILLTLPLTKAFSDSARASAIAARRAKAAATMAGGGAGPQGGSHGGGKVGPGVGKIGPNESQAPFVNAYSEAKGGPGGGQTPGQRDRVGKTGDPIHVEVVESTPLKTKVKEVMEVTTRYKPPSNAGDFKVSSKDKAIEYSSDMLKEKYGPIKGQKAYEGMTNTSQVNRGVHFVAHNKIVQEKLAMMSALGKQGSQSNHDYQGLYKEYVKAGRPGEPSKAKKLPNRRST